MSVPLSLLAEIVGDPQALAEWRAVIGTQPETIQSEPWVDARGVAEYLGYELPDGKKPQAVYDLARPRDGALPSHKVRGRMFFRLSEVDAWVESGGSYVPPRARPGTKS